MRNLLLILLLANILYWMWGMLSDEKTEPGVAVLQESELGPPINVRTERDNVSVASVGAVLGSGEPSALQAVVGRACVTIGPFRDNTDADSAVLVYTSEGMHVAMRSTRAQIFVGHWVQIRNIASDAEGNEMLAKLQAGGLSDAYLVRTDDEGLKISLGLFGDLERAEKIELEARSMDLNPEISQRTRESDVYFVDIGLPRGKGAGAIIEKYGEERVLLRDKATCPQ